MHELSLRGWSELSRQKQNDQLRELLVQGCGRERILQEAGTERAQRKG